MKWGGPGHYVITPSRVEVKLRLSWALTTDRRLIAEGYEGWVIFPKCSMILCKILFA